MMRHFDNSDRTVRHRRAFTLVELLVVITIIGILTGLVLNGVAASRRAAARMTCGNHQRQIALAAINYESAQRKWPAGRIGCDNSGEDFPELKICPAGLPADQKSGASGFVSLLPYLEEQALYNALDINGTGIWNDNTNDLAWYRTMYHEDKQEYLRDRPELMVCPADRSDEINKAYVPVRAATGSYAFVNGVLGPDPDLDRFQPKYFNTGMFVFKLQRKSRQITDGLSKTAMLGEVTFAETWESSNIWTYAMYMADSLRSTRNPLNTEPGLGVTWRSQNGAFGSYHNSGANFAYADGHVEFLPDSTDALIYNQMATIQRSLDNQIRLD